MTKKRPYVIERIFISRTMLRALTAIVDGHSCRVDDRPKFVTIRTMRALRNRGLVMHSLDGWQITPAGRALVD